MVLLIIVAAWLLVYRTGVGTWCAATGKQTPWAAERKAKLAHAQAKADAGLGTAQPHPRRTARGFFGRLWGDWWEDAHGIVDRHRARAADRREHGLPGAWASLGNGLARTGRAGWGWLASLGATWRAHRARRTWRQSYDRRTPEPATQPPAAWQSRKQSPPPAPAEPAPHGERAQPPAPPSMFAPPRTPSMTPASAATPPSLPAALPMAAPPPPMLALPAGHSSNTSSPH